MDNEQYERFWYWYLIESEDLDLGVVERGIWSTNENGEEEEKERDFERNILYKRRLQKAICERTSTKP